MKLPLISLITQSFTDVIVKLLYLEDSIAHQILFMLF